VSTDKTGTIRQFVTFRIDKDLFGFDIRVVKEVNPHTAIASVPLAPGEIRGLVNIRGQIVLVMDIAILFGRPPRSVTELSQLVIIKTRQEFSLMHESADLGDAGKWGDKPVAFLVDSIGDVLTFESSSIDRVPPHIPEQIARYIEGVRRVDGELLILLDAQKLMRSEETEEQPAA
jgi:purine-binding chemotaxis protein CheW